jgi:hypothetical protein
MPHVLLLGKCLIQPPPMDSFHSIVHSIVTSYWEQNVNLFLSKHDPSQLLMQFHQHFAKPVTMALGMGFEVGSPAPMGSSNGIRWWSPFLCILGLARKIQATKLGVVTIPLHCTMISAIDTPRCLSSKIVKFNVIIDTGASVCILSHQSDFGMYGSSAMKI